MDGFSRYLLRCEPLRRPLSRPVQKVFEATFREYGLPQTIRTDNGAPFSTLAPGGLSRLAVWWIRLGFRPERIVPGRPDQNGRHERMHSTLKAETARPPRSVVGLPCNLSGRSHLKALAQFISVCVSQHRARVASACVNRRRLRHPESVPSDPEIAIAARKSSTNDHQSSFISGTGQHKRQRVVASFPRDEGAPPPRAPGMPKPTDRVSTSSSRLWGSAP
jgi:hypothetical protein